MEMIIEDMDYSELVKLREELDKRMYEKAIMYGYKDGFKDGQKSERDRFLIANGYNEQMIAVLTELQLEIKEQFNDRPSSYNHHQRTEFYRDIDQIIQQKIDKLKGE